MPGHDIIVIGCSAGGVEALAELVRGLPADLPASLFIVHHFPAQGTSVLPAILQREGPLPAGHGRDGESIRPGRLYVAPPNHHLLVKRGHVSLARGPRENGHRPAVDPLFRSAALAYGRRVVGVILSGTLDDGASGLLMVKKRGGVAVVQDPDEAQYAGMPLSAIEHAPVDHIVRLGEMGALLARLAREPVQEERGEPVSNEMESEEALTEMDLRALGSNQHPGTPSGFACPECGGVLWELSDGGDLLRFRCRVGHALSGDALLVEQTQAMETALWSALRALEERVALGRRLTDRARRRGHSLAAERFQQQVRDTEQQAATIREVLMNSDVMDPVTSDGGVISTEDESSASGKWVPDG